MIKQIEYVISYFTPGSKDNFYQSPVFWLAVAPIIGVCIQKFLTIPAIQKAGAYRLGKMFGREVSLGKIVTITVVVILAWFAAAFLVTITEEFKSGETHEAIGKAFVTAASVGAVFYGAKLEREYTAKLERKKGLVSRTSNNSQKLGT